MSWLIKEINIIESGNNLKTPAKKLGEAKYCSYIDAILINKSYKSYGKNS